MTYFKQIWFKKIHFLKIVTYIFLTSSGFSSPYSLFHEDGPYAHAFKNNWVDWVNFQTPHSIITFSVEFQGAVSGDDRKNLLRADLLSPAEIIDFSFSNLMSPLKKNDETAVCASQLCGFTVEDFQNVFSVQRHFATFLGRIILSMDNKPTAEQDTQMQSLTDFLSKENLQDYLSCQMVEMLRFQRKKITTPSYGIYT